MPRCTAGSGPSNTTPARITRSSSAAATSSAAAATTTSQSQSQDSIKKRRAARTDPADTMTRTTEPEGGEPHPILDGDGDGSSDSVTATPTPNTWAGRNQWIVLALASGGCAAFNGVFAKLTTTELTTTFSQAIARFLGLSAVEGGVELITRSIFFGLNLAFNGVMWALFTKALTRGNSTTQVSIINTSSNFVITAILGFAIFSEALPPLWWLGAAMLVAGNVIIGRKDEGSKHGGDAADSDAATANSREVNSYQPLSQDDGGATKDVDEDVADIGAQDT